MNLPPSQEIFFVSDSLEAKEKPFDRAGQLTRSVFMAFALPKMGHEAVCRSPWRLWNWRAVGWALTCAQRTRGSQLGPREVLVVALDAVAVPS